MDILSWLLIAACVALVCCPAKYDPAIRLKERNERRARGE